MKYFFSLLVILVFVSSCRNNEVLLQSESIINVRLDRDPQRINPVFATNTAAREVYPYVFLQLAEYDPVSLSLSPILAKSIPQKTNITQGEFEGGISYTFEILEEAVWTDGTPILASDYVFTLKAINHPGVAAPSWKNLLNKISDVLIDKNNPKKFTVVYTEPYIKALSAAASFELFPEHVYDKSGVLKSIGLREIKNEENHKRLASNEGFNEFATTFSDVIFNQENCTGSGPYILSDWETDQYIRLIRKENFWGNAYPERTFLQSNPKEIIFNIIPDEVTAITQLKSGQIDMMSIANGENYEQLIQEKTELQFYSAQIPRFYFIAMNNSSAKLQDKRVRKALSHLIDVDEFIELVEYGKARRTIGTILPFKEEYNNTLQALAYDEEKASALLKEAGWIDTDNNGMLDKEILGQREELTFDMYVTGGQLSNRLGILLKENCKKVGAKINIIQKDGRAIRRDHLNSGNYDMYPMVISASIEQYDAYSRWHSDNAKNGGSNLVRYNNATSDLIINKLDTVTDAGERKNLYLDLQKQMYEDQPVIFLYSPFTRIATSAKLEPLISVKRPGYFLQTATITEPAFSEN